MRVGFSPSGVSIAVEKTAGTVHTTSIYMIPMEELLIAASIIVVLFFFAARKRGHSSNS
jgi:hypothetical protein